MTASLTIFDHLALHDAVADFPAAWLHRLAACGSVVSWPESARLLREGSPVDRFWLLNSGAVQLDFHIPGRGDLPFETLGDGDVVGWSWVIPPYRSTVGALVVEPCEAIEMHADAVRELIGQDPRLGVELTTRMLVLAEQRLRTARQQVAAALIDAADCPA